MADLPAFTDGEGNESGSTSTLEDPQLPYGGFTWTELGLLGGLCVLLSLTSFLQSVNSLCCAPSTHAETMRAGGRILLNTFSWGGYAIVVFWACVRLRPNSLGWGKVIGGHLLLAAVIGFIGPLVYDLVHMIVFALWPPPNPPDVTLEPLEAITDLDFLSILGPYTLLLLVGLGRFRHFVSQARQEHARRLQQEAQQLRSQLTEARLESLRMQINPHFFHNTLHTISTMAGRDPDGIRRATARLSDLMRHVLSTSDQQELALEEELDVLESYLDIQKLRLDERLDVTMDIDPQTRRALVPTLLLQPLVENAVKHGFEGQDETGHLKIRAHRDDDSLVLEVSDDGHGLADNESIRGENGETSELRTGDGSIGLENIAERLEHLYGDAASLDFEKSEDGGLRVVVRIPFRTDEPETDFRASGVVAE